VPEPLLLDPELYSKPTTRKPVVAREDDFLVKNSRVPRATAETMATRQRDISVSEFFAKNRHLLGFDNPRKALLTTVKEAVDNSLDACEEAGILPDITIAIEDLSPPNADAKAKSTRYRITVVDNGPGIVRKQVENIFGRLLYGSKFHRLKMSRGQQGIGISAAGMYGLITTGKPMVIHTKPKANQPVHHIELAMNTKTNRAEVMEDSETEDFPPARLRSLCPGARDERFMSLAEYPTGTSVSIELEGRYQRGRGSVDEFLELTAIANPHAKITFVPPSKVSADEEDDAPLLSSKRLAKGVKVAAANDGAEPAASPDSSASDVAERSVKRPAVIEPAMTTEADGVTYFPRAVAELPPETKEIQPHPRGIELGILLQMLKEAEQEKPGYTLYNFLQDKFCRVSPSTASSLCDSLKAPGAKVTTRTKVTDVDHALAEKLFKELQTAKLPPPPTDCLAPIGVQQLLKGMFKGVRAEFYAASSREPDVYRGRPFQIEAAIAFGGELPADDSARVIRFANRVPLLFQQSACSSFKSVVETNWRNYDLQQPRTSIPIGPLVIMIHMASVWVPFTSESKEAIADYDEIRKEMKLALMECGRKLGTYLRKRLKMRREGQRRDVFERYIGEIAKACNAINGVDTAKLYGKLLEQARERTAVADVELDEDGRPITKPRDEPGAEDGVIIVTPLHGDDGPATNAARPAASERDPFAQSKAEAARLKVAAMRDDDDQPRLLDAETLSEGTRAKKPVSIPVSQPFSRPTSTRVSKSVPKPEAKSSSKSSSKSLSKSSSGSSSGAASRVERLAPRSGPKRSVPSAAVEPKASKPAKPKMRLVNGKLVLVDDGPRLF